MITITTTNDDGDDDDDDNNNAVVFSVSTSSHPRVVLRTLLPSCLMYISLSVHSILTIITITRQIIAITTMPPKPDPVVLGAGMEVLVVLPTCRPCPLPRRVYLPIIGRRCAATSPSMDFVAIEAIATSRIPRRSVL